MNQNELLGTLRADAGPMIALRRDLHAHPELAFSEQRTADRIVEALSSWGIEVHRGIGRTGVVGVLHGGDTQRGVERRLEPARSLGLRADMDALPVQERNRFAHASRHPGRMHACGHDGHMAMLLAAARHLAKNRRFEGTVYFVFQPAEEAGGGAREMIRDGLFERFPMQAIFGAHNWPGLAAGRFALRVGPVMASSNEFHIRVRGRGSHAALPHNGVDPVPVACQLVQAFQTILTRNVRPIDAGVISVTMMRAGEAINVVADECELKGTVRTFRIEVLDLIEQRMRQITEATCQAFGARGEFSFHRSYPPTINHARETEFARWVLTGLVGAENIVEFEPTMGAEDFSFYLAERPGCYLLIGNGEAEHRPEGHGVGECVLHGASYDFNDALIPLGAALWVSLVQQWLSPGIPAAPPSTAV